MDSADSAIKGIFLQLTSPEVLAEVTVIVITAVIALAVAHVVRVWHLRRKSALETEDWQNHALEGVMAIAPMLLMVVLLLYQTQTTWPGLLIVLLGVPVYLVWSRRARMSSAE